MATNTETPAENTETSVKISPIRFSNRQMRAILSAIMARAATDGKTPATPESIVEAYHGIYKELRQKGIRPKS